MVFWIKILNQFNGLLDKNTKSDQWSCGPKILNKFNGLVDKNTKSV